MLPYANDLPWTEKYRPHKINDIVIDHQIMSRIKNMIERKELHNLILEGPPGVGKTSTIECIAKNMYGPYYKYMVLGFNAADDRGIRIQDAIDNFIRTYVHIKTEDKDKYETHKLIILDEVDNMTNKAKYIVSNFIENEADKVRFALTCNVKSNVLPSIQSKCIIINYPKLSPIHIYNKLKHITRAENITPDENGLKVISDVADGDLRIAINLAQLTFNRFGNLQEQNIYEIYDKPSPAYSIEVITACLYGDIQTALKKIVEMKAVGYSGMDILLGFVTTMKMQISDKIPEDFKVRFLKIISHRLYNISKGVNTILQLSACCAEMCELCQT